MHGGDGRGEGGGGEGEGEQEQTVVAKYEEIQCTSTYVHMLTYFAQ